MGRYYADIRRRLRAMPPPVTATPEEWSACIEGLSAAQLAMIEADEVGFSDSDTIILFFGYSVKKAPQMMGLQSALSRYEVGKPKDMGKTFFNERLGRYK